MKLPETIKPRTFIYAVVIILIVAAYLFSHFMDEKKKADESAQSSLTELEKIKTQEEKDKQKRKEIEEIRAAKSALAAQKGVGERDLSPLEEFDTQINIRLSTLDELSKGDGTTNETKCLYTGYDCLTKVDRAQIGLSTEPQILEAWKEFWYVEISVKNRASDGILTQDLAKELDAAVTDISSRHPGWLKEFQESMLPGWVRLRSFIEDNTSPATKYLWGKTFEILESMTHQIVVANTDDDRETIIKQANTDIDGLKGSNSTFTEEFERFNPLSSRPSFWQARAYIDRDFRFTYP